MFLISESSSLEFDVSSCVGNNMVLVTHSGAVLELQFT